MGQTPPPWHGQAVATQILFDHDWPDFEVHRLRMEFSEEMVEVGRFQLKKLNHLWNLIREARRILKQNPGTVLFYPPASAKWIPFLRDVLFLSAVRHLAGSTVFIFHASGLPVFVESNPVTRLLGLWIYRRPEVSLEVAREVIPPHQVFGAGEARWCPCAIAVPEMPRAGRSDDSPFVALFVGSLQEGKGVLELLRTAAILKNRGLEDRFRFRIVGKWFSREFEAETRSLHRELELENMVEIVGQLTGDAKWRAYAEADVFFFPTHYESEATPIVIMEALGMGCPVLSTEWAGIPAMLEGCAVATLLPIRSPEAYANTLLQLESDPRSNQTERLAKDYYRDHYLPERFIERVNDAFRTAASGSATCSGGVSPSLKSNAGDRTTTVHPVAEVCDRRTNPADDQKTETVIDHDGNSNGDKWPVHGGPRPTEDSTLLTSHPALGTSSTSHSHAAPGGSALPAPGASHSHGEKSLARGGPRPTEDSTLLTSHSALGTSSENCKLDTSKLPPGPSSTSQRFSISASQHLHLSIYLADQNPKLGRSLGISRMTEVILDDLKRRDNVEISLITSRSSLGAGMEGVEEIRLPWSTRSHLLRVLTDQLHPLAGLGRGDGVIHYFPKGFLPLTSALCRPCVVTIHDTIIQYYSDHYPKWRKRVEYQYWATVLRHTLSNADAIMTVSESSRRQIESFMGRHGIPPRPIHVTFESCVYENVPQPEAPEKGDYVIHLASREPHKRTAQLVRWWVDHPRRANGLELHLIGKVPDEVAALAGTCERIVMRPFLDEPVLQQAISRARALAFPSEIEGFGLPAIEAYYLGTPVCHSRATSVEEVLAVATCKGAFTQNDADSFFNALDEVIAMSPEEVRACGLKLRETYATAKVAERMLEVFRGVNAEKLRS